MNDKNDKTPVKAALPDEPPSMVGELNSGGRFAFRPDFGIFHLSLNRAAELVVLDMWHSGYFSDVEQPENVDDPKLIPEVVELIRSTELRLAMAVEHGRLQSSGIQRNFDESIVLEETFVKDSVLRSWLDERGVEAGDSFNDYFQTELEIAAHISDEVNYLRAAQRKGLRKFSRAEFRDFLAKVGDFEEEEGANLLATLKAVIAENESLQIRLAEERATKSTKVDRPLHPRQRRTLLTIIAALCKQAGIDLAARGAAQRVKEAAEGIGAPIDDGTIAKMLSEIPDALETRMR